ncbi:MAG: SNF2-related protein [bacterium]|nr:SNF2-related protein [bacterium]
MTPQRQTEALLTPPTEEQLNNDTASNLPLGSIALSNALENQTVVTSPDETEPTTEDRKWMNCNQLAKSLGYSFGPIKKRSEAYRKQHPEWFEKKDNSPTKLHPDLIDLITQDLSLSLPEHGEISIVDLADELSALVSRHTIDKYARKHPDSVNDRRGPRNVPTKFATPELADLIRTKVKSVKTVEEGWVTRAALAKRLDTPAPPTINKIVDACLEEHPEWAEIMRSKDGNIYEHLHPDLVQFIVGDGAEVESAREGEKTVHALVEELNSHEKTIDKIAGHFRAEHPEWFVLRKDAINRPREHYVPELVALVTAKLSARASMKNLLESERVEKEKLKNEALEFVTNIYEGETIEAQEFQQLLQLFGSERAVDILFQFHPEYQKMGVPFVKKVIGDYLGQFLMIRGDLQLEALELGTSYLSDHNLKEGLTEVIKNDCLKFYNQQRRAGLEVGVDDLSVLMSYVASLRARTAEYLTPELAEIWDEIEDYYKSLFEVIQIPDNVVDELEPGRLFPDINQRINIIELIGKEKMLIADEMGVGKSASAILAKESLGVKQALIVVPSNVVDVWQKYLSDYKNGDGEAKGYFKEGQEPSVLIVESLEALRSVNPADYDYVIISQERLTNDYMTELENFDYDMLIVDEAHKLKNISSGKRAENLIKLAEEIEGEDKYLALLSGTPIPNKVGDVAMILKLLYPEKFQDVSNKALTGQILQGDVLDLRSLLVPRMQMKSLAESIEMPQLHEELHVISMSHQEQTAYEVLLEEDELTASQKLQFLRQFVLNPQKFEVTPDMESTKVRAVGEALRQTFADKNKVVMFVNGYVDGVIRGEQTIFDELNLPEGVEVHVIDGSVSKAKRLEIQSLLQASERKILLAVSGQTADVGVDFSGAEEVYFYNEPWTEYDKKQELGRVFRPGLKNDLISHTFYVRGTVEEGIHKYIEFKYTAVEKLLRGIPLSELERQLLADEEKRVDPNLEVNPALAEHYLSSWSRMLKIYNYVKEIGEEDFVKFVGQYGREYAECYTDLGSRSYQANASRLSATVIDGFAKSRNQPAEFVRILDVASGPEMLKRHIGEEYQDQVVSVDINPHHFEEVDDKRRVGSFLNLPVADSTIDYANLSLALHYTKFSIREGNYERIEVFKELNRVLVNEGVAVINLMHNLDLKNEETFAKAIERVGFKVVESHSGEVSSANNFRTRLITLQKVSNCPTHMPTLVQSIGGQLLQGFKFDKTDVKLRDSRKIVTSFILSEKKKLKARFNQTDQRVLEEEQATIKSMKQLKSLYGSVENIPKEKVIRRGLARAFTGKTYVLFKSLDSGDGAVITR